MTASPSRRGHRLKRGRPKQDELAAAIVLMIRGKDVAAIKRCMRSLLTLKAVGAERQAKKLIAEMTGSKT